MTILCNGVLLDHPLPNAAHSMEWMVEILRCSSCCRSFKNPKNVVESIHLVCKYALGTKTLLKYRKTLPTHYRNVPSPTLRG